jgi:hypothetical protein
MGLVFSPECNETTCLLLSNGMIRTTAKTILSGKTHFNTMPNFLGSAVLPHEMLDVVPGIERLDPMCSCQTYMCQNASYHKLYYPIVTLVSLPS